MPDEKALDLLPGSQVGECNLIHAVHLLLEQLGWRIEIRNNQQMLIMKSEKGVKTFNLPGNLLEKDLGTIFLWLGAIKLAENEDGSLVFRLISNYGWVRRGRELVTSFNTQKTNLINPHSFLGKWTLDNPSLAMGYSSSVSTIGLIDRYSSEIPACTKHSFKIYRSSSERSWLYYQQHDYYWWGQEWDWWQSECYLTPSVIPSHPVFDF